MGDEYPLHLTACKAEILGGVMEMRWKESEALRKSLNDYRSHGNLRNPDPQERCGADSECADGG